MKLDICLSKSSLFLIPILLLALNLVIRFPIAPHELGTDSFFIHALSQTICSNNYAVWLLSPLSFFGLYPYSYASGLPHLLAITSLTTDLNMEWTIYYSSLIFGLLGVIASFSLASEFSDSLSFRSLVALLFTLAPLTIGFTLWTASSRGILFMITPLFVWCLLRWHKHRSYRYGLMLGMLFLTLAALHKTFVLLLLVFLGYILANYIYNNYYKFGSKNVPYLIVVVIISLFIVQFFFMQNAWAQDYNHFAMFKGDAWYHYLIGTCICMTARLGILLPLSMIGLITIVFKPSKLFTDWFLLCTAALSIPLLGHSFYVYQTLQPFFIIFAAIGILSLLEFFKPLSRQCLVITILVLVIGFSSWVIYASYTNTDDQGYKNYMKESAYSLTQYIEQETENQPISGGGVIQRYIGAYTSNPVPLSYSLDQLLYEPQRTRSLDIHLSPLPKTLNELSRFVKKPFASSNNLYNIQIQYLVRPYDVGLQGEDETNNIIYCNGFEEIQAM